jgi:hypothetical protein
MRSAAKLNPNFFPGQIQSFEAGSMSKAFIGPLSTTNIAQALLRRIKIC